MQLRFGIPKLLTSLGALNGYAGLSRQLPTWTVPRQLELPLPVSVAWRRFMLSNALIDATVVVAKTHALDEFGIEALAGKTLITTTVNPARLEHFKQAGVQMVIDASPLLFGQTLDPSLLDAMIIAALGKPPGEIREDDYLQIIANAGIEPVIHYPNGIKRVNRFAFVIHTAVSGVLQADQAD